jgi:hypothetical protein
VVAILGLAMSGSVLAGVHLLLERDVDIVGQTDLFLISYASQADLISNTGLMQTALPVNLASSFSAGGLTADAFGGWHLLLERNVDVAGQTDLFLISYASQADFLSNTGLVQTALPLNLASNFSSGGLTADAFGGWHLLLERNVDVAGQTDLFLISYASQADFLSNTGAVQTALPLNLASNFSAGGLAVDAFGGWHLLLERDVDVALQADLFLISYASQADFLSNTGAVQTALPLNLASNFSAAGLHFDLSTPPPPPPHGVPEPPALPLLALVLAALASIAGRTRPV